MESLFLLLIFVVVISQASDVYFPPQGPQARCGIFRRGQNCGYNLFSQSHQPLQQQRYGLKITKYFQNHLANILPPSPSPDFSNPQEEQFIVPVQYFDSQTGSLIPQQTKDINLIPPPDNFSPPVLSHHDKQTEPKAPSPPKHEYVSSEQDSDPSLYEYHEFHAPPKRSPIPPQILNLHLHLPQEKAPVPSHNTLTPQSPMHRQFRPKAPSPPVPISDYNHMITAKASIPKGSKPTAPAPPTPVHKYVQKNNLKQESFTEFNSEDQAIPTSKLLQQIAKFRLPETPNLAVVHSPPHREPEASTESPPAKHALSEVARGSSNVKPESPWLETNNKFKGQSKPSVTVTNPVTVDKEWVPVTHAPPVKLESALAHKTEPQLIPWYEYITEKPGTSGSVNNSEPATNVSPTTRYKPQSQQPKHSFQSQIIFPVETVHFASPVEVLQSKKFEQAEPLRLQIFKQFPSKKESKPMAPSPPTPLSKNAVEPLHQPLAPTNQESNKESLAEQYEPEGNGQEGTHTASQPFQSLHTTRITTHRHTKPMAPAPPVRKYTTSVFPEGSQPKTPRAQSDRQSKLFIHRETPVSAHLGQNQLTKPNGATPASQSIPVPEPGSNGHIPEAETPKLIPWYDHIQEAPQLVPWTDSEPKSKSKNILDLLKPDSRLKAYLGNASIDNLNAVPISFFNYQDLVQPISSGKIKNFINFVPVVNYENGGEANDDSNAQATSSITTIL